MLFLIRFLLFTVLSASAYSQEIYYVQSDGVRIRAGANEQSKVLGLLNINDQVIKLNAVSFNNISYVEIKIISSTSEIIPSKNYYIGEDFLATTPIDYKEFKGRYFLVINVASEILRLYERICSGNYCYNKMILETEAVVGEDKNNSKEGEGKGRSILGSYRLTTWRKFYEDGAGHYPAWFNENYPPVPPPGIRTPTLWFADKYMPVDANGRRNGKMRGAFGWYTALLTPAPYGQWIHGTMGWGEDKNLYIQYTKTLWPNILFDPRSSGCIRNNNEAIAYIRQLLEPGAPIIKIYAQEKIYDPTSPRYKEQWATWKYVLTKKKNQRADRSEVIKELNTTEAELDAYWAAKKSGSGIILDPSDPLNLILEVGTYTMDIHPDASKFIPGEYASRLGRKINPTGNVYGVKGRDMRGVFFVDTGLLYEYEHPKAILEVSGYPDEVIPPWMQK